MDVKNASLHGDLKEEVYMEISPGFEDTRTVVKVCRLKRSLYGLKQSPRAWFDRFRLAMVRFGYHQSSLDHNLFIRRKNGKTTLLIVYVDDIVLTGNDIGEMSRLKEHLAEEFEIKDLGVLRYFLGIEVARSPDCIFLSQQKYVLDLLKDTGMLGCRPAMTPVDPNHGLQADDGEQVAREQYQRTVGRLIYLSHTRPDIAYAVSLVSQFMHDPRTTHSDAVDRILRYLKSCPGKGILLGSHNHLRVEVYTDADWAGLRDDRKSTSGYCSFVEGNLVTWQSKKQNVVARSSAEAEYRALALGVSEAMWIRKLMAELQLLRDGPVMLYCDNKAAIDIANNPVQHDRTKHIEIDRHFIREKLDSEIICLPFEGSSNQLADVLTKGFSLGPFIGITSKMDMCNIFSPS